MPAGGLQEAQRMAQLNKSLRGPTSARSELNSVMRSIGDEALMAPLYMTKHWLPTILMMPSDVSADSSFSGRDEARLRNAMEGSVMQNYASGGPVRMAGGGLAKIGSVFRRVVDTAMKGKKPSTDDMRVVRDAGLEESVQRIIGGRIRPMAPQQFRDDAVSLRVGVLNTPAVSGPRYDRVDRLIKAARSGDKRVEVPTMSGEGTQVIDVPTSIRGKELDPFWNMPSSDPVFRSPVPEGFNYPVVMTGNPHLQAFNRPHESWDELIKTVRAKPVHGGTEQVNQAVADSINYAHDIGATPLLTTFRFKNPYGGFKYIDPEVSGLPMKPTDPGFGSVWQKNKARAAEADINKRMLMPAYVPQKGADDVLTGARDQADYHLQGSWKWPNTKALDEGVIQKVDNKTGDIQYCDLLGKGCTTCKGCAKHNTRSDLCNTVGLTDEAYCAMGCPQCFVGHGQSGTKGRSNIAIGKNAKQAGFGQGDLGEEFYYTADALNRMVSPIQTPRSIVDKASGYMDLVQRSPQSAADEIAFLLGNKNIDEQAAVNMLDELGRAYPGKWAKGGLATLKRACKCGGKCGGDCGKKCSGNCGNCSCKK